MDATKGCTLLAAAAAVLLSGARFQTDNFIVETSNPQLARQFALAAENYRYQLAVAWLGKPMPDWSQRCFVTAKVGDHLGAGGATTFVFDRGEVFGWRMTVQGSAQRIIDSVLPHEITHTIFASHFRRPLPRWADEGGATTVEHPSERAKQYRMLVQFLRTGRGIAFSEMFRMSEYPHDIMPLYAQGYTLAEFLIQQQGRRRFLAFLADGMQDGRWSEAVRRHYGYRDLGHLQNAWLAWVSQGFPRLKPRREHPAQTPDPSMLASTAATPGPQATVAPSDRPARVPSGGPDNGVRPAGWSAPGPIDKAADDAVAATGWEAAAEWKTAPSDGTVTAEAATQWPGCRPPVSGNFGKWHQHATSGDWGSGWKSVATTQGDRAADRGAAPIGEAQSAALAASSPAATVPAAPPLGSRPDSAWVQTQPGIQGDAIGRPVRTQVSHPQPIQPLRQIILEWGHR